MMAYSPSEGGRLHIIAIPITLKLIKKKTIN